MRAVTLSLLALTLSACSGAASPAADPVRAGPALPGAGAPPLAATDAEPKPLPGVGDLDLEGREATLFWQLVSQLYAPCAEQAVSMAVSIRQCVEEQRPCTACAPAARLLADKVKEGVTGEQAREIYGLRFGPEVKQVDVADSPARGPVNAPVTVVVWSDFECPHCRLAMPVLEKLLTRYAPKMRLVHKFYPLHQHMHARDAARAAIAAQAQGKYWEMERVLFEHQSDQTDADIDRYAQDLGLDLKRFHDDARSAKTEGILERDHDDAERLGLTGTPFIMVNGRVFEGAYFHLEKDFEPWLKLEIEMAAGKATAR
jgi:protein-disulfide isomerase